MKFYSPPQPRPPLPSSTIIFCYLLLIPSTSPIFPPYPLLSYISLLAISSLLPCPYYPLLPFPSHYLYLSLPYFCSLCVPFVSCSCTKCTCMCVVTLFYVVHACMHIVCLLGFVMCVLSSRARSVDLHVLPDGNSTLCAG